MLQIERLAIQLSLLSLTCLDHLVACVEWFDELGRGGLLSLTMVDGGVTIDLHDLVLAFNRARTVQTIKVIVSLPQLGLLG